MISLTAFILLFAALAYLLGVCVNHENQINYENWQKNSYWQHMMNGSYDAVAVDCARHLQYNFG